MLHLLLQATFPELMEGGDKGESIFDSKSGGKQYRQATTSSSPYEPSTYSTEEDEGEPTTPPPSPTLSDFEEGNWPSSSEEPAPTSQESFEIPTQEQAFFTPTEEEGETEILPLPESTPSSLQEPDQPPSEQEREGKEEALPPPSPREKKEQKIAEEQKPPPKKRIPKEARS